MNIIHKLHKVDNILAKYIKNEYVDVDESWCYIEHAEISFLEDFKDLTEVKVNFGYKKDGNYRSGSVTMTIFSNHAPQFIAGMIVQKIFESNEVE
jgi:hypothetical protein